jgi:hypothetical protein
MNASIVCMAENKRIGGTVSTGVTDTKHRTQRHAKKATSGAVLRRKRNEPPDSRMAPLSRPRPFLHLVARLACGGSSYGDPMKSQRTRWFKHPAKPVRPGYYACQSCSKKWVKEICHYWNGKQWQQEEQSTVAMRPQPNITWRGLTLDARKKAIEEILREAPF